MVVDELQYLGKWNKSFPSVFQKIWDELLADSDIMAILCGSIVGMMFNQTLSYSSPLYGRRTGQIRLTPIGFSDYPKFFENPESIDLIEHYAVTGGVPKYIELFDPSPDIFEAIEKNVLSKQTFLYEEPIFLLERELGEIGTYFSIIKSIAAGNRKLGTIAASLGIKQTGATNYLKTLAELDLVERSVPVTEKNPEKSKKGLYTIKDNFIRFWFRFVYPYRNYLEIGNTRFVTNKIKANFRDNHVSFVYEDICRQKLLEMSREGVFDFAISKSGKWWDNKDEIDIVAMAEEGDHVVLGECKYTEHETSVDVYYRLREKSQRVECLPDARRHYVLFSKSGFSKELRTLADLDNNLHLQSSA